MLVALEALAHSDIAAIEADRSAEVFQNMLDQLKLQTSAWLDSIDDATRRLLEGVGPDRMLAILAELIIICLQAEVF